MSSTSRSSSMKTPLQSISQKRSRSSERKSSLSRVSSRTKSNERSRSSSPRASLGKRVARSKSKAGKKSIKRMDVYLLRTQMRTMAHRSGVKSLGDDAYDFIANRVNFSISEMMEQVFDIRESRNIIVQLEDVILASSYVSFFDILYKLENTSPSFYETAILPIRYKKVRQGDKVGVQTRTNYFQEIERSSERSYPIPTTDALFGSSHRFSVFLRQNYAGVKFNPDGLKLFQFLVEYYIMSLFSSAVENVVYAKRIRVYAKDLEFATNQRNKCENGFLHMIH